METKILTIHGIELDVTYNLPIPASHNDEGTGVELLSVELGVDDILPLLSEDAIEKIYAKL